MKTKISLIIALFFTLSACNNWLDIELDNKVEDSKLFSTPEGFEEALAAITAVCPNRICSDKPTPWNILMFWPSIIPIPL